MENCELGIPSEQGNFDSLTQTEKEKTFARAIDLHGGGRKFWK